MHNRSNYNDISKYVEVLTKGGGELYEVGGPVRDRLMGKSIKDHDLLCRHLSMKRISALLAPYGKVAAVGKSFGVIKFSPHRGKKILIDIALPRRELSTGTGHRDFAIHFDPEIPVEDDLGRRDFTINAMAMSLADGKIIDPFDGRADLKKRILRIVFPKAFEEDPLRLVRAVQFAARFDLRIEEGTWNAMCESAHLISTVSGERIGMEIVKLMSAMEPSKGFDLMLDCGLLAHVLPELVAVKGIEQDKQPGDDVYGHTMRALDAARTDSAIEHKGDLEVMFATLLHDIGKSKTARFHPPSMRIVFFGHQIVSLKLARRVMERLKLSSMGIKTQNVLKLIENHMFETKASFTDRAIRRFVAKVGKDLVFKLLDVRLADNRGGKHPYGIKGVSRLRTRIREELSKKPPFGAKDLAINGKDLMKEGIPEGPAMGAVLSKLVEHVLDEPSHNNCEQLLALAKQIMENPDILQEVIAHKLMEKRRKTEVMGGKKDQSRQSDQT